MATIVKMPQLGESVAEGTIGRWLKQPGDRVERDEPLVEIQTDKVNAEVPSPVAGVLQEILLPEGTTAAVKSDMAVIGEDGDASTAADQPRAPEDVPTPSNPTFAYDTSPGTAGPTSSARHDQPTSSARQEEPKRFYTPVVLRIAEEHGLDLSTVEGTGTNGRVTRRDVERMIASGQTPAPTTQPPQRRPEQPRPSEPQPQAAPATAAAQDEQRPLTPMRRAIAEHMTRARAEIPDAWSLVEVDVSHLSKQRDSAQPEWQAREGYELTYLPFFIKAVLAGLRAVPELNATWSGDHVTVHRQVQLGIAVSVENGLVVPVLRDAEQLSVAGVARQLRQIVQKARAGKLSLEDLQGATFHVNNPGSLGSIMSQPIVPVGAAGIVTMEAIVKRPVVTADDAIAIRPMMNCCLSFDHRVLDGAQALRFLRTLKEHVESADYPVY